MKFFNGLKGKIILLFLSVCFVVIGSISGLSATISKTILEEQVQENLYMDSKFSSELLGNWFSYKKSELETYAGYPLLQQSDTESIMRFLSEEIALNDDFSAFLFVDLQGNFISTEDATGNIADRDYFQQTLKNETTVLSEPILSRTENQPVVTIATPIENSSGNTTAVLVGALSLENINTVMAEFISAREDVYSYIVDSTGLILSHPVQEAIMVENITVESELVSKNIIEVSNDILGKSSGFVEYNFEGRTAYAYFHMIPETNEWKIVTRVPGEYVSGPVQNLLSKLVILSIVIVVIVVFISIYFGNSITKPLLQVKKLLDETATLDLRKQNDDLLEQKRLKHEIRLMADALTNSRNSFRDIIGKFKGMSSFIFSQANTLSQSAGESSNSIQEISKTVQDLAQGAQDQAKNADLAFNKLLNLNDRINKVAQDSNLMLEKAEQTKEVTDKGNQTALNLSKRMQDNIDVANKVGQNVNLLSAGSKKIGNITTTIQSIAEQINLLALNAAIEAARAGEHGKGFGVVADEIRKLSEKTSESIREIDSVIESVQSNINGTNKDMEQANNILKELVAATEETIQTFKHNSETTTSLISQIELLTANVTEMDKEKEFVSQAIESISSVTEESAAGTEEISAIIQSQATLMEEIHNYSLELRKEAEELEKNLIEFKLN